MVVFVKVEVVLLGVEVGECWHVSVGGGVVGLIWVQVWQIVQVG